MAPPRIGFVTCVELGLACLDTLVAEGAPIEVVVTLDDAVAAEKSGRVHLDDFATRHDVPLLKVASINDADAVGELHAHDLDWLFIVGWSQIAKKEVLNVARKGTLGMHPTLLPVGRGRAPIPWTILKGLTTSGVTLFQLDEGVDTGPIVGQDTFAVDPRETATTLYAKVTESHRRLTRAAWRALLDDNVAATPQDDATATLWPARRDADGEIRPDMTVEFVDRLVRATTHPYPGAFWVRDDGSVLRVWAGAGATGRGENAGLTLSLADGRFEPSDYTRQGDR